MGLGNIACVIVQAPDVEAESLELLGIWRESVYGLNIVLIILICRIYLTSYNLTRIRSKF